MIFNLQQTIMNIPSDLLARIQATGITEEDYKRVEQYINTIANIAPTVSPEYYILDYYRMKSYHTTPQQDSTGSVESNSKCKIKENV